MKLSNSIAAIAVLFTPVPALAVDKPPISLARVGKWEMNYDEDSCHLTAQFGEGAQLIAMRLTRFEPSDSFDLTLYGNPLKSSGVNLPLAVRFGTTFSPNKREAMAGSVGGKVGAKIPLAILSGARFDALDLRGGELPPAIAPEQEAAITSVALSVRGKHYQLETGSLGKPMTAMRACLSDLIAHWGFDAAVQQSLSRPVEPLGNPGNWLTSNDYPTDSLRSGHMGLVQFRLDVSEAGGLTGCRVLYRTNPDDFADRTCALLSKRAKLAPALDAAGKPVKSYFIGKVRWILPPG
jgi:hypothetical protein